jgi:hypothetical protein
MKQVGISGDYLEQKLQREAFEYAQKRHLNGDFSTISEPMVMAAPSRLTRIRRWFFTPRGALLYFGLGWAGVITWLVWK